MKRAWIFFLLPSLAGVLLFVLVPFADVLRRSFYTAVNGEFQGIENYKTVLSNSAFRLASVNTIRFVVVCLPILLILSLCIAMLLSKLGHMQILKSLYLFPMAVPAATVAAVWKIYASEHMNSDTAFYMLVVSYLWKNLGYTVILWLAGIVSVSESLTEAAKMDGASEWQNFLYVMFPNLKPMLYTISVLSFLNSFKAFREAYLVAGNYPHESMYLLQHLFNNWFLELELEKMAAAAVLLAVFLIAVILIFQFLWDEKKEE